jgi:hypothetical protein
MLTWQCSTDSGRNGPADRKITSIRDDASRCGDGALGKLDRITINRPWNPRLTPAPRSCTAPDAGSNNETS